MSKGEASLKDLRGDDPLNPIIPIIPLNPIIPLLNEMSSKPEHNHPSNWHSFFFIGSWFQKSFSFFKHRAAPSHAEEPTPDQSTPLMWEDFEDTSHIPIIDDGPRFATLEYLSPWFPEANPAHPKAQTWRTWRSKRQTVLSACSVVAFSVLLANIAAIAYFKIRWKGIGDLGTIHRGDCSQSHRLNSGLHIIINVLSTILLAASNLCMQLLAAPTRQEIDKAHKHHIWLDIGVPSFRNLKHISIRRRVAIFFLALSSIPLHFLYNSTIIPTVAVNTFAYIAVDPSFLEGGYWNTSENVQAQLSQKSPSSNMTWMLQQWHGLDLQPTVRSMQVNARNSSRYFRIDTLDCILTYNDLLGNRSDFIMVSTSTSQTNNSLLAYGMSTSDTWDIGYSLCSGGDQFDCGRLAGLPLNEQMKAIQDWSIGGYKIDYCLSSRQSTENLCSVEYSFSIMLIVCIFSLFKCILILYTALYHSSPENRPLSIVGDAICSFLQTPDKSTQGLGLASKQQISKNTIMWRAPVVHKYQHEQPRWLRAVTWRRWALCLGSSLAMIITGTICLGIGIAGLKNRNYPTDFDSLVKMGFGTVQPKSTAGSVTRMITSASSTSGLYQSVAFSNFWQFAVSVLYLAYNAVFTAMLVANEWDRFGETRKSLRVTEPQGHQRSTYFISVPLKYGLPVIVTFSALHYTISQSVFVIYLIRFFSNGTEDIAGRTAVPGYSWAAIMTSIVLACALLLGLILTGILGRYRRGTPLASTCSAAISAACHRPSRDTQAHMFQVQWGVVSVNPKTHVGHCAFTTAKDVTGDKNKPESGHLYA